MPRLSPFVKKRILNLRSIGYSIKDILKELLSIDDLKISRESVEAFLIRYERYGNLYNQKPPGRNRKLSYNEELQLLEMLKKDPELSLADMKEKLNNRISESTICRILARHEQVSIKTRYCQVISRENVEKRNAFASLLLYFGLC
ncbi:MAG: hypothetical protein NT145_05895 [Elusimicrobia bacterium]|nr:hypothetical protein [Elusimicrobiota bacterium]